MKYALCVKRPGTGDLPPKLTVSLTLICYNNVWCIKQLNRDPVYYCVSNVDGVAAYIMGSFTFGSNDIIEMYEDTNEGATKGEILASWKAFNYVYNVQPDKAIKNILSMLKSTQVMHVGKD